MANLEDTAQGDPDNLGSDSDDFSEIKDKVDELISPE